MRDTTLAARAGRDRTPPSASHRPKATPAQAAAPAERETTAPRQPPATVAPKAEPVRAERSLVDLGGAPRDLAPLVIAFFAGGLLLLALRQTRPV